MVIDNNTSLQIATIPKGIKMYSDGGSGLDICSDTFRTRYPKLTMMVVNRDLIGLTTDGDFGWESA